MYTKQVRHLTQEERATLDRVLAITAKLTLKSFLRQIEHERKVKMSKSEKGAKVMGVRAITKESKEMKRQRLSNQRSKKLDRAAKMSIRKPDEKKHLIELANIFSEFCVGFLTHGKESYAGLKEMWEGRLADDLLPNLSPTAKNFLHENFTVEYRNNQFNQTVIHFTEPVEKESDDLSVPSKLIQLLIKESGQPRSVVDSVYCALVDLAKSRLKKHRRFVLPGLGRLSVKYRKEQELLIRICWECAVIRLGLEAAKKEKDRVAAGVFEEEVECDDCHKLKTCRVVRIHEGKPARNVLRMIPSKSLKEWMTQNIPVEPLVTKHKKHEKKKHRKKKVKSHFDNQVLPAHGKTLADKE